MSVTGVVPLTVEELRERQLRILDIVTEHCRSTGIRYYLCAGTLLGAVRHEGYIPWDDDIDIMLPRPDFERLCATFGKVGPDKQLSLRSAATDARYQLPFAKICDDSTLLVVESDIIDDIGIYVDVFPLDGWYPPGPRRWVQAMGIRAVQRLVKAKHLSRERARGPLKDVILATIKFLLAGVPARALARALTRIASRPGYEAAGDVGVIVWGYHEVVPRRSYGAGSSVTFEGRQLAAPSDPDDVLRRIYGDYLTLPPEHQRITHHRFTAYARNR